MKNVVIDIYSLRKEVVVKSLNEKPEKIREFMYLFVDCPQ